MERRRKPDSWAHVRAGDIVSFDTTSPRCDRYGTYVHSIRVRDDGKHVIVGTRGENIVEHKTYRLRLDRRSLTFPLRDAGILTDLDGFTVAQTFDWCGKEPPRFEIESWTAFPPGGLLRIGWDAHRTRDVVDDTALLLEVWSEAEPDEPLTTPVALRAFNPATRELTAVDKITYGFDAETREFVATTGRQRGFDAYLTEPAVRWTIQAIMAWVYEHRFELADPGQPVGAHYRAR